MKRPHMQKSGDQIRDLVSRHWDDFAELALVAYELQFRSLPQKERKAEVIERLVHLGMEMVPHTKNRPAFDFPTTDIYETRRRSAQDLGAIDWRETGLLLLSGYRVGVTHGKTRESRRRLLNFIFLKDDLRDVADPAYAAEWGSPMTSERLEKLTKTIAALTRNAKKQPRNMNQAISHWEEDLDYLRTTFYERWGDFPWPEVEI